MSAAWIAPPPTPDRCCATCAAWTVRRSAGGGVRRVCAVHAAILPADRSLTALGCAAWMPNERDPFAIALRRAAAAPPA